MNFEAEIVDQGSLHHFMGVMTMVGNLTNTCTIGICPDKMIFTVSQNQAIEKGMNLWCELRQERVFSKFQMEGISAENNGIFLELGLENVPQTLEAAKNAKALKIKLINRHPESLVLCIELSFASRSRRPVTYDFPVKVIPRNVWKDFREYLFLDAC
ncbi:checkpoint protein HUS1-like [Thomomys bottae]